MVTKLNKTARTTAQNTKLTQIHTPNGCNKKKQRINNNRVTESLQACTAIYLVQKPVHCSGGSRGGLGDSIKPHSPPPIFKISYENEIIWSQ